MSTQAVSDYNYIDSAAALEAFVSRAAAFDVIALDTEFLREKNFFPKLCLVQIATPEEIVLIDPFPIGDLSPLRRLFDNPAITKVLHACSQDLEVLDQVLGAVPAPVFDTQVAACFLGHRMQMGYGALVDAYTDSHLAKAESLTDWSKRPLDERQLGYAADDVRYLIGIYRTQVATLQEKGRLSWVLPEMEEISAESRFHKDPREAYLKVKKSSSLTRRQLGVAREVAAWREESAMRRDHPRKWVLSDELVVEVAKRAPQNTGDLARIRGTEQISDRAKKEIVEAVRKGLACPEDELPQVRRNVRPPAEAEGVVDLMYAVVKLIADANDVAAPLLTTRDELFAKVAGKPCALDSGWRHELVGTQLDALLSGQIGLTVKEGRVEFL